MSEKAGNEVADFNQAGEDELERAEEKITESGLQVNIKEEVNELVGLNQEAKQAKDELRKEVKLKNQSRFIQDFSREHSQEDRNRAAKEIQGKRRENRAKKVELGDREKELQEKLTNIRELEKIIAELSENGLSRLRNYFKIRSLRSELAKDNNTYDKFKSDKIDSPDMNEPKRMLNNFYEEQKKKWENSPYTKDDITKNFSEEHLASLSLEDYALLMKRFPSEMVAHVTRQGVRDHTGMVYHTKGQGEFHGGFNSIIEDGRLRSPLGITLVEREKEKAMEKFLNLDKFSSKKEALEWLNVFTREDQHNHSEFTGEYVDSMAVHFTTEHVADDLYGGEKGNEIFFTFPSAQMASQYYFNGQLKNAGGGYWNDQWVWANEEKGIDINSGIVFISENAKVDPKNGSRYELDENGKAIIDNKNKNKILEVINYPDFDIFANEVMEISGKMIDRWDEVRPYSHGEELLKQLEPFREKLEKKFGITDKRLQYSLLSYSNLRNLKIKKEDKASPDYEQGIDHAIENVLSEEGILFMEAKGTVSSKEYWEEYFAKNPKQKPNKIVYYKGNPTKALWEWQSKSGLKKKSESRDLGFSERSVSRSSEQAISGMDRFSALA